MTEPRTVDIRDADLPRDRDAVERLWLGYLTSGSGEMEAHHGFRLPVRDVVEQDLVTIEKFQSANGRLVMAFDGDGAFGIGCLRLLGVATAEVKRIYVEPAHRRMGAGRAILDDLLDER